MHANPHQMMPRDLEPWTRMLLRSCGRHAGDPDRALSIAKNALRMLPKRAEPTPHFDPLHHRPSDMTESEWWEVIDRWANALFAVGIDETWAPSLVVRIQHGWARLFGPCADAEAEAIRAMAQALDAAQHPELCNTVPHQETAMSTERKPKRPELAAEYPETFTEVAVFERATVDAMAAALIAARRAKTIEAAYEEALVQLMQTPGDIMLAETAREADVNAQGVVEGHTWREVLATFEEDDDDRPIVRVVCIPRSRSTLPLSPLW